VPGAFGWLPFRSFLNGSFGVNVQSLFEKAFLYGSLIWIAARAGLKLQVATTAATMLLLMTSVVEIYLPGRSAEITDALITLLMGTIIVALTGSVHVSEHETSASKQRIRRS
jgi:hypothetical protein